MQTSKGLTTKEKKLMRILVVSICSLALVSVASVRKNKKRNHNRKSRRKRPSMRLSPLRIRQEVEDGRQENDDGTVGRAKAQNGPNLNGSVSRPERTRRAKRQRQFITGKRRRRLRLPTLLIKLRKPRRTKPKLRDKQPKQRTLAKRRRAGQSRTRRRLRLFRARTRRKGSSPRASRLSRSTSIFQNSRILQRRRP